MVLVCLDGLIIIFFFFCALEDFLQKSAYMCI